MSSFLIGVGSRFSSSTVASIPGQAGARTRWPRLSYSPIHFSQLRGVIHSPWINTIVLVGSDIGSPFTRPDGAWFGDATKPARLVCRSRPWSPLVHSLACFLIPWSRWSARATVAVSPPTPW
jgi:hypothetical protein